MLGQAGAGHVQRIRGHGLSVLPARSKAALPSTLNTHSPTSCCFLNLTSYTPQNTAMNLLRTAAQMLAMWTKGPWERSGARRQEQQSSPKALAFEGLALILPALR